VLRTNRLIGYAAKIGEAVGRADQGLGAVARGRPRPIDLGAGIGAIRYRAGYR
jgi:hypothetical protein